jgi:hypothetical protein
MKKLTPTQQRVWDALEGERVLFFWPAHGGFGGNGHYAIGTTLGNYDRYRNPRVPITTIQAMMKSGALRTMYTFQADATGRRAYALGRSSQTAAAAAKGA